MCPIYRIVQRQCAPTGDSTEFRIKSSVKFAMVPFCQNNVPCKRARVRRVETRTSRFTDINIFVGAVIFVGLIYCGVSLCGGGRITVNISPPYRTKIEYLIRRRDINNSYSRPVFSGQLKSFCRIDDISYARGSSDTGLCLHRGKLASFVREHGEADKIIIAIRASFVDGTFTWIVLSLGHW